MMKVGKPSDDRVIVTIKVAKRDQKTNKIKYETVESFDVYDADPEKVFTVAYKAISAA